MAIPINPTDPAATDVQLAVQGGNRIRGLPPTPDVLRYERVQEADEELGGQTPQTSAYMPILEDETTGQIVDYYA
jgi:hypothetical protein